LFSVILSDELLVEQDKLFDDLNKSLSSFGLCMDNLVSLSDAGNQEGLSYRIIGEEGSLGKSHQEELQQWADNHPLIDRYQLSYLPTPEH